jgi:hydroxyacylglutathione hydrolase
LARSSGRFTLETSRRSLRKDALRIEAFVVPPLANNVYIVYEDGGDEGLVIDVAQGADLLLRRLKELELHLGLIVNTHGHSDHTLEDDKLRRATGARLAIHELDAYRLAMDDEASRELGLEKKPVEPDVQLVSNQLLNVGDNITLKVLHTPGHTEGSICLLDEKRKQLFSGDTLFAGSYGRTDSLGGDPSAMVDSLKRLSELPESTDLYPGHGRFSMIGAESWIKNLAKS